jgi:hypothetical protein
LLTGDPPFLDERDGNSFLGEKKGGRAADDAAADDDDIDRLRQLLIASDGIDGRRNSRGLLSGL